MKKALALGISLLLLSSQTPLFAMEGNSTNKGEVELDEKKKTTTIPTKNETLLQKTNSKKEEVLGLLELSDAEYLKILKSSRNRWKLAGHAFEMIENFSDALAYVGVMFSQIIPGDSKTTFTYAMVAVGGVKLLCLKLVSVAQTSVEEADKEIASLSKSDTV
ncbi:hypothetical protein Bealeia1_01694 [Candidatus Bealeia paramacronuclearis]|uniref:Uncharacterized protein n=1 Tax=Candidatus Bealeia paramacronuclearis TaxID=1921001 RepID=A0ABZ2C8C1_9PROT|nr:hypothetical protein [Candidatus Bealeia paramacronuclearis]